MKKTTVLLWTIWLAYSALAQSPADTSRANLQALSMQMQRNSFYTALPELERLSKIYPANQKIQQLLGDAYQGARLPDKAAAAYEAGYNPKSKTSNRLLLPILLNYFNAGNYPKSRIWIDQIEKRRDADGNTKARAKALALAIDEMAKADTISSRFAPDTSVRFPNSGYADFAAARMDDTTMIFTSLRQDSIAYYDPALPNFATHKIYLYARSGNHFDRIESPKILTPPGQHSGNGSFTPDGKHFYFTRCIEQENGKLACSIFRADVENGKFRNVRKLDGAINKTGSSNTQPFVVTSTAKNTLVETLYFVSDRKGGAGGADLWMATYNTKKNKFGNAANLGRLINTPGDETTPFIDPETGHLYFSSDFLPGYGGKDIFLARKAGNGFGKPINLGRPVNSMADDAFFRFDGKDAAYLSSNRKGAHQLEQMGCCEDIFFMKRLPKLDSVQWLAYQQAAKNNSTATVANPEIPKPVPAEETKALVAAPIESKPLVLPKTEVAIGKVDLKTKNDSKGINQQTTNLMKAISQNIQFELGSNKLTANTLPHLDSLSSLLRNNRKFRISLTGHTDNKGSKALNTALSKKRADAVKAYLTSRGVERTRITTYAKGPLVPLFPNTKPDGSDNPEGRAKNRRVTLELKKL